MTLPYLQQLRIWILQNKRLDISEENEFQSRP